MSPDLQGEMDRLCGAFTADLLTLVRQVALDAVHSAFAPESGAAGGQAQAYPAKLAALRRQLGEEAWAGRIAEAGAREERVLSARALLADGATLAEAARRTGLRVQTLARWIDRWDAGGLEALISRKGSIASKAARAFRPDPAARGSRVGRKPASFIKWAGSKAGVMRTLLRHVPERYGTYYEPMVGSGTLFFRLAPPRSVLGDENAELMAAYEVVRDRVEPLIRRLRRHENEYEHFLAVRAQAPDSLPPVERAARLIYLNKTCFNGLYRVNLSGRFNVPFGRISHAKICDAEMLRKCAHTLRDARLRVGHFRATLAGARAGDLVYLDPPYLHGSRRGRYHRYQPESFDETAHRELAAVFRDLDRRGCRVLLSNSDVPAVRELYRGFHIEVVPTRRPIHWDASKRKGHTELLVTNAPVRG